MRTALYFGTIQNIFTTESSYNIPKGCVVVFVLSFNPKKIGIKGMVAVASLTVLLVFGIIFLSRCTGKKTTLDYNGTEYSLCAETEKQMSDFLKSLGYETAEKADAINKIIIPADFNEVYTTYNELQKSVGFDLSSYSGKECVQYTYCINNTDTPLEANLLVYNNVIIGGDVHETVSNGTLYALLDKNKMLQPQNSTQQDEQSSIDPSEVSSTERATLAPDPEMPEAPTD